MQKTLKNIPKKTLDFFSLYRSSQFRKYFLSGSIAVVMAFSVVSISHGDVDMQGLMASVSSLTEDPRYDADIIMSHKDNNISMIFGAKATKVDKIDFTILSDPTRFRSLKSSNSSVHIIGDPEMGAYHVSIDMFGRDIVPGTHIIDLLADIDIGTPIAMTDTFFMSTGERYSLTNKSN